MRQGGRENEERSGAKSQQAFGHAPCLFFISRAISKKACSTFVEFFEEVSTNGTLSSSASFVVVTNGTQWQGRRGDQPQKKRRKEETIHLLAPCLIHHTLALKITLGPYKKLAHLWVR